MMAVPIKERFAIQELVALYPVFCDTHQFGQTCSWPPGPPCAWASPGKGRVAWPLLGLDRAPGSNAQGGVPCCFARESCRRRAAW